ncbi:MAG: hypothetical protein WA419_19525 [Silvibacterium sp.]
MKSKFSESEVHQYLYSKGLEALTEDEPGEAEAFPSGSDYEETGFELWRLIKFRAESKIRSIHESMRYGEFIGSKVKLPTDKTQPMELDLLGSYDDGLFILELKVDKSAERNAFSELFAYSNYIAEMFALSGQKDITNVLVANLDAKITKKAFLYDLLIADRNIIVYTPEFATQSVTSLRLKLYLPSDDDFKQFTNQLISHDAMQCVVLSFEDIPGWIDSDEEDGSLQEHTVDHLEAIGCFAAQLMEAEGLHGFCFVRKPWQELPRYYRNSLIVCAVNPFQTIEEERATAICAQLDENGINELFERPQSAFRGRLIRLAKRVFDDSLKEGCSFEFDNPDWSAMVNSFVEVVGTHNFGFHPTGLFRESYVSHINAQYASDGDEDLSMLKIEEVTNWLKAWTFMEGCGLAGTDEDEDSDDDGEA